MAIPQYLGADIGTQLSSRIRAGRQSEANISQTNLANRAKRLEIEEFIRNKGRRKAERSLGTASAESGLRQLPGQEALATMQRQEALSEEAQLARSMKQKQGTLDAAGDILATATESNWSKIRSALGSFADELNLPESYDEGSVNRAMGGIINNMAQQRAVGQAMAKKTDPAAKQASFQAVNKKTGDIAAVSHDPASNTFFVQEGVNEDGSPSIVPLDPSKWNLTQKSETTTKKALEPTTSTKTLLQQKLIKYREQTRHLKGMAKKFTEEYLSTYGRILGYVGHKLDLWGHTGKKIDELQQLAWEALDGNPRSIVKWNSKRSGFMTELNQFFNAYRHDITGAQSSYMEIQNLKRAIMNEDMGAAEVNELIVQHLSNLKERADETLSLLEQGFTTKVTWVTNENGTMSATEEYIPLAPENTTISAPVDTSKMTKRTTKGGATYYVE